MTWYEMRVQLPFQNENPSPCVIISLAVYSISVHIHSLYYIDSHCISLQQGSNSLVLLSNRRDIEYIGWI